MAAHVYAEDLSKIVDNFDTSSVNPENFLKSQPKLAEKLRTVTKNVYDFTKLQGNDILQSDALPELIIEKFDDEQVWQEVELQNDPCIEFLVKEVSQIVANKSTLLESLYLYEDADEEKEESDEVEETEKIETVKPKVKQKCKKKPRSQVDDKFFSLSEMEAFLDKEDEKEAKLENSDHRKNDDEDESSDSVDYFDNMSSSNGDSDEDSDDFDFKSKSSRHAKYQDFFDPLSDEDIVEQQDLSEEGSDDDEVDNENVIENEDKSFSEEKNNVTDDIDNKNIHQKSEIRGKNNINERLLKISQMNGNEDSESEGETVADVFGGEEKSSFEEQQQKLKKKIKEFEKINLAEKPWQLRGEATANIRPENSLLQEYVEFDHTMRQAPVITEQTTKSLEDLIRQRIKDQAWDDVERKVKPTETPEEFKKKLTLDQEKSKLSLSQIYEKEFVKQTQHIEEEKVNEEHEVIKKMMQALFIKLDALSNFHFVPKPPIPEIKVISNLPAITMEEVAPVYTNNATLLAPEEVQRKPKGDIKGDTEKSATDRKHFQRVKKARQKIFHKHKEKKERLKNKLTPEVNNMMKSLIKASKVGKGKKKFEKNNLTSSKEFFSRLQDKMSNVSVKNKKKKK